jgi:hypothetical protein
MLKLCKHLVHIIQETRPVMRRRLRKKARRRLRERLFADLASPVRHVAVAKQRQASKLAFTARLDELRYQVFQTQA